MATPKQYLGIKYYDQIIGGHREWLGRFPDEFLKNWDQLFTRDDSEVVLGVMHPRPNYKLDTRLFEGIKFCELAEGWEAGKISVEWMK